MILVAIVILALVTAIAEPRFLSLENMTNIMRQFGPLIMVSLGMTFVIIGGFIDLSVTGIVSLVAVVTLSLIEPLGQIPALLIGLALGAICGLLTSTIIISWVLLTQAEALFITFGMSTVYGAIALIYTGGETNHLSWVTRDTSLFNNWPGNVGFISVSFLIFLVVLAILWVFQNKTYMGRAISLTGNKTAAWLTGININRCIRTIYVICGFMTALGAIVLFSRVTTASRFLARVMKPMPYFRW